MNNSAERLCLPQIDEKLFMEALETLVRIDESWVPSAPGTSLYLRPFLFGNDPFLGVHTVQTAEFLIIASPVGSYYKEGLQPVSIMIVVSPPSKRCTARTSSTPFMPGIL